MSQQSIRRQAFSIRPQRGMPRAFMMSLVIHAGLGAALCLQAIPAKFIRMADSDTPQLMEILLIDTPSGGQEGVPGQAGARAPEAKNEPASALPVNTVPKIKSRESVRPKAEAQIKKIATTLHQKSESASTKPQELTGGSESGSAKGAAQNSENTGTSAAGGSLQPGGGGPFETAFGQADAPRFIQYVPPRYPLAARQQGLQGTVVLRLTIDERGRLVKVEVVSSPSDGFAESAVEAIERSSFAPAMRNGTAVASRAVLPVRFALRK